MAKGKTKCKNCGTEVPSRTAIWGLCYDCFRLGYKDRKVLLKTLIPPTIALEPTKMVKDIK